MRAGSPSQQFQIPAWEEPNNSQYSPQPRKSLHFSCMSFLFPEENTSSLAHRNVVTQEASSVKPCEDFKGMKPLQAPRSYNPIFQPGKQTQPGWVRALQPQELTAEADSELPFPCVQLCLNHAASYEGDITPCSTWFLQQPDLLCGTSVCERKHDHQAFYLKL